jgi:hypothetical protein
MIIKKIFNYFIKLNNLPEGDFVQFFSFHLLFIRTDPDFIQTFAETKADFLFTNYLSSKLITYICNRITTIVILIKIKSI